MLDKETILVYLNRVRYFEIGKQRIILGPTRLKYRLLSMILLGESKPPTDW
jgi:hypothetical protein